MDFIETTRTELTRPFPVRPGEEIDLPVGGTWWERDRLVHNARLHSAIEHTHGGVAVLQSAVLLWGGALWHSEDQAQIHLPWRPQGVAARGTPFRHLTRKQRRIRLDGRSVEGHTMAIDTERLAVIDGITVTDLAQTVFMSARFLGPDDGKVAVESLAPVAIGRTETWRQEDRGELERRWQAFIDPMFGWLEDLHGRRGVRQAKEILRTSQPFAESPSESEFHRKALAAGYFDIEPQMRVRTRSGDRWTDFGCRRANVGFDISGDVKYEGPDGARYRIDQAARDDSIRDTGTGLVNLSAHDVADTPAILDMLDSTIGQTRAPHGIRALWTRSEERRFGR